MNGRDLTLGLVGALAAGAALGRRGSRARWRGQTSGPVHSVAYHFGRSASLRPGFGRGIHWGTEWSALDRWSTTGKPPGQLVTAQIQLDRPLWTGEVCQWLDPGCVLWNLTDDLGVMRRLAEDGGVRWRDDFDLEEAREALDRLDETLNTKTAPISREAAWNAVWNELERQGYDGVAYENNTEDAGSTSYITFRPSQVRVLRTQPVEAGVGWATRSPR